MLFERTPITDDLFITHLIPGTFTVEAVSTAGRVF
jgi:hypothetical protein